MDKQSMHFKVRKTNILVLLSYIKVAGNTAVGSCWEAQHFLTFTSKIEEKKHILITKNSFNNNLQKTENTK